MADRTSSFFILCNLILFFACLENFTGLIVDPLVFYILAKKGVFYNMFYRKVFLWKK